MSSTRKPRVLVADDESHIRVLMKAALSKMNCEVVAEAKDGQETIDRFRECRPDMLLLDINMPLKSGEEVTREIRQEFPDALIVILSSVADLESVEGVIDSGAAHYIRKDTPLKEMMQIIRDAFQEHYGRKPLGRNTV